MPHPCSFLKIGQLSKEQLMKNKWIFPLMFLMPLSTWGGVSFQKKLARVHLLEKLDSSSSFNLDAYRRELEYQRRELNLEQKVNAESELLKRQLRSQIIAAYEAALAKHGDAYDAFQEVHSAIQRDLSLIDPALKAEIEIFSLSTLDGLLNGSSIDIPLPKTEEIFAGEILARTAYLDLAEAAEPEIPVMSANPSEADKMIYASKQELLKSLGSDGKNSRYVFTAHQPMRIGESFTMDEKLSLRVKAEFLGVGLEAGPSINFVTNFSTDLAILVEGSGLSLTPEGNFDLWKRDGRGNILMENGEKQRRYIGFNCEAKLNFRTNYSGGGSFSFMGIGGGINASKQYSNQVGFNSRRLSVPESVGGKVVDLKYLSSICNQDFLGLRLESSLTVRETLREMMKSVVQGMRYSHPKTNCAVDHQCKEWFRKNVITLMQKNNVPRCIADKSGNFMACEARGIEGQRCPLPAKPFLQVAGPHLRSKFEFSCDRGLSCVPTRTSLTGSPEGRCQKPK
jgi:hypothetical protein